MGTPPGNKKPPGRLGVPVRGEATSSRGRGRRACPRGVGLGYTIILARNGGAEKVNLVRTCISSY